jgi:hypothetical protein
MNRNNQMGTFSMILFAIAALALYFLLTGCAPAATVARMDGFNSQWRGFEAVRGEPATKSAKITLEVIVGELQKGWAGSFSHPQGIIRIRGKMVNGKVILPEAVLGHEVLHALQFQAEGFHNPDTLTQMGY